VVCVRNDIWRMFRPPGPYSYLNLARYHESALRHESPHTPAMALLGDLRETLSRFTLARLRADIDERRRIVQGLPHAPGTGPVITLRDVPEDLARRWQLYSGPQGYQLFLWSGETEYYHQFRSEWRWSR